MKNIFLSLILTITAICAISEPAKSQDNTTEKTIIINDARKYGVGYYDTTVIGYQENEVKVDKGLTLKSEYEFASKDTVYSYTVHFFKIFEGKLRNYSASYVGEEEFDKATYKWTNDTNVTVTLLNSITNIKYKFRLFQTFSEGTGAGMMIDDDASE